MKKFTILAQVLDHIPYLKRIISMKKVLLVFLIPFLMGTQCKKEDCHNIIYINNNSVFQIIAAIKVENADGKCRLDGKVVNSNEKFDYQPFNSCIENNMGSNSFIELYIEAV